MTDMVAEGEILDFQTVGPEQCLVGDGAEGDDHLEIGHGGQLRLQMPVALANFRCRWLVGRRQATDGVGDTAIV